ncbi:MAG: aldehyde dehydrogenase family protein [Planctomycetota bacterium]|nr:aldehyde dehydrogenase family protein [Planctomycetota bacterium]
MNRIEQDTLISLNPATGEEVGRLPITPVDQIAAVVATARAAQPAWGRLSLQQRADQMRPFGDALVSAAEELGTLLTREMGKPLAEGIGETKHCGSTLGNTLDELIEALTPEPMDDKSVSSTLVFDPLGVCAGITPWNFPLSMPHWTVIPALMAGNSVVLKPSEKTPLVAQAYAELLMSHLPEGVLQVIHGDGTQGQALVAADVDLIAFTGSRATGAHILESAGGGLKRVILELGGKDPLIVLDDADLEAAAKFAASNSFRNAGQVCVSTERIYVQEPVLDQFQKLLCEAAGQMQVGDGCDDGTEIGPMIDSGQKKHVEDQVEKALSDGAEVLFRGEDLGGNFFPLTVLSDCQESMDVIREETFGPVACVLKVTDDAEAIDRANNTPYGLGAAVFGSSERAHDIARQLTAGMVGINKGCGGASGTPWVGAKQSGYGYHSGRDGHRQFAQLRVISEMRSQ